jgi:hypothetical protein
MRLFPKMVRAQIKSFASGEMGWVNDALKKLADGEEIQVRPFGGSMRGRLESGQLVTLAPVQPNDVRVEDVVPVRWRGNYLLHLVKEIQASQFLIGNGWRREQGLRRNHRFGCQGRCEIDLGH